MKLLKKALCLGLAGIMALCLVACGGEEKSVTMISEQDGVKVEYTMDAKGDVVHTITQVSTIDCSAFTDEDLELIKASAEECSKVYGEYEGVEYSYSTEEGYMHETIVIDVSDMDMCKELAEQGMLPIEGNAKFISLKLTIESMEEQGFVVQE